MKRKSTGRSPRQTKLQFVKRGSQPDKEAKLVTPDTSFNSSDDVSAAPIKAEADATPSSKASTTKAGISASPAKSKPGAPPLNAPTPAASDHDVLSEESDSESDDDEPARKKGDFRALRASNRADIEKHMRSVETAAKRAGQPIPGVSRGGAARPAAPPRRRSGHGPSTRAAEKKPPPVPTRASARLAGIKAEQPGEEGAAAGRLRGEIADLHATSGDNSAHRKRKVGDLALADIATGQANGGMDVLKGLGDTKGVKTFTEEDIRQTTDKELKALREQFARLQLYKKWEPNSKYLGCERSEDRECGGPSNDGFLGALPPDPRSTLRLR